MKGLLSIYVKCSEKQRNYFFPQVCSQPVPLQLFLYTVVSGTMDASERHIFVNCMYIRFSMRGISKPTLKNCPSYFDFLNGIFFYQKIWFCFKKSVCCVWAAPEIENFTENSTELFNATHQFASIKLESVLGASLRHRREATEKLFTNVVLKICY